MVVSAAKIPGVAVGIRKTAPFPDPVTTLRAGWMVTETGIARLVAPVPDTEMDPKYEPAERPVGFTVTDRLEGVTPEAGLTRIHGSDACAENAMPEAPPIEMDCGCAGFWPKKAANARALGEAAITACTCTETGSITDPGVANGELIVTPAEYDPGARFIGFTDTVIVAAVVPSAGMAVSQGALPGTVIENGSGRFELLRLNVCTNGCVELPPPATNDNLLGSGSNGARTIRITGTTV